MSITDFINFDWFYPDLCTIFDWRGETSKVFLVSAAANQLAANLLAILLLEANLLAILLL